MSRDLALAWVEQYARARNLNMPLAAQLALVYANTAHPGTAVRTSSELTPAWWVLRAVQRPCRAPKCRRPVNPLDARTRRIGYVCSIDCRIDLDNLPRLSEVGR